jgi:hypothetical protein
VTPEIVDVAQIIETDRSSSSFHENLSAHNKKIAEDTFEKLSELNSRLTAQIQRQQVYTASAEITHFVFSST